jgi:hypothetical protein
MASRREAVAEQLENRLAARSSNTKVLRFDIHAVTLEKLKNLLLDGLLSPEATQQRHFSVKSEEKEPWCNSHQDAIIYCSFFQRCVEGVWSVTFLSKGKSYSFEFVRS